MNGMSIFPAADLDAETEQQLLDFFMSGVCFKDKGRSSVIDMRPISPTMPGSEPEITPSPERYQPRQPNLLEQAFMDRGLAV